MPSQDLQNLVRLLRAYAPNVDVADHGSQELYPLNEGDIQRFVAFHDGARPFYPEDPDNAEHHRVKIYAEQGTGKLRLKDIDTFNDVPVDYALRDFVQKLPRPDARKAIWISFTDSAVQYHGLPSLNFGGTGSADWQDTYYLSWSPTAGTKGGLTGGSSNHTRLPLSPTYYVHMRTGADLSSSRIYVGLFSSSPTGDSPSGSYVAFRHSSSAGDVGWVGRSSNGSSSSGTASIAPIAESTTYKLRIRYDVATSTAYFQVNGGTEVAIAATLPGSTTGLGMICSVEPTTTVVRTIATARIYLEMD